MNFHPPQKNETKPLVFVVKDRLYFGIWECTSKMYHSAGLGNYLYFKPEEVRGVCEIDVPQKFSWEIEEISKETSKEEIKCDVLTVDKNST